MKTLFLGMIAALSAMVVKADFGDPEIARSIKIDPAEKMVLVENGKSNCVIVLSEKASPTAGFAAGELSKFLKLATGADVPVVKTAAPDKISIFVGSGADVSKLPRDGFIIRGSGKKIVIAGKDDAVYVPCAKRKKWGDYFVDIFDTCIMHSAGSSSFRVQCTFKYRTENCWADFSPIECSTIIYQNVHDFLGKVWNFNVFCGKKTAVYIRERF